MTATAMLTPVTAEAPRAPQPQLRASPTMKILVVDDDPQLLDALTVGFQLQWQDAEVLGAPDGELGLQSFYDHNPDVVVLDLGLPLKTGFDVLREIRRISDVPVVILTARDEETDEVRGLELGADDYVTKPFSHMKLVARIKAVLRRAELPPPVDAAPDFTAGDLTINFQANQVILRGQPVKLTPVEYKLLFHLARNAGRLLPHQTLIDRIWGADYGATAEHLRVFISRLRAKLEPEGDKGPRFIETERGLGYRFVRPTIEA